MRMVESETHNKRTPSVPSVKHTLSGIGHSRSSLLVAAGIQNGVLSYAAVTPETYEDMATGTQQIRRFQRPNSSLKTSQQETPSNIYKRFIFPETRVIGLHFCRCMYGSIFIQICAVASKRRIFSTPVCILTVQAVHGHPTSMILVPIESTYMTSY